MIGNQKNNNVYTLLMSILLVILVSGCSSIKYYPNTLDKNMNVTVTVAESGSFFQDIETYFHVYTLDNQCTQEHLGVVDIPDSEVEVGIEVGKRQVIEVAFEVGGNFMSSSTSVTRADAIITPRKDYYYQVNASYDDGIYDMEVFEKKSRQSKGKAIKVIPAYDCQPK